jgi:hypothetical protein
MYERTPQLPDFNAVPEHLKREHALTKINGPGGVEFIVGA